MPTPPHGHSKVEVKDRPLANDFMPDEEFGRMLLAWFGNIARVIEHGRVSYIWGVIVTAELSARAQPKNDGVLNNGSIPHFGCIFVIFF